jgi:hypothetical protein
LPEAGQSLREILKNSFERENLPLDTQSSLGRRYREFLEFVFGAVDVQGHKIFRRTFGALQVAIPIVGAALGFFLNNSSLAGSIKAATWIAYLFIGLFVASALRLVPDDSARFELEAKRLKLICIAESLASKITLFDRLTDIVGDDDKQTIEALSRQVPELNTLPADRLDKITKCLDDTRKDEDPRISDIEIPQLITTGTARQHLDTITREIWELAPYMFDVDGFTAKLYGRVQKTYNGRVVDLLVALSKYPTGGSKGYGSSWVKTRGLITIVWKCVESGMPTFESAETFDSDYKSVGAICLPGRVGVLALTSRERDAFDLNDRCTHKALALVARQLLKEAMAA